MARRSNKSRSAKNATDRRTVAVVGGAGAMGRIVVRDLVETAPPWIDIVIADRDVTAARALARRTAKRARAVEIDAADVRAMARALAGTSAIINCCRHELNLAVMEAALAVSAHYCDLGGLFHITRKQLEMHARFERAGLLAVPGMGAAPGVVNVLARAVADPLDEVREIHIAVGGIDRTPGRVASPLSTSYSLATVLDEASQPAAIFTGGRLRFVEPMSGAEPIEFPPPVGLRRPARTIHSELATLPRTYRRKGIREASFRIAFSDELDANLRFLRALGLLETKPIRVGRASVAPRDVLMACLGRLPQPTASEAPPDEYEVLRVTVRGRSAGREVEEVIECHTPGIPAWGFGVDVDTGCPPSIVVQMILDGAIEARGVLPPEVAVPAEPFFRELGRRGMRVLRPAPSRAREMSS